MANDTAFAMEGIVSTGPLAWSTVLVHVDDDASDLDRISYAAAIAKRFGATLMGISAGLPRPPLTAAVGLVVVEVDSGETRRVEARLAEAERRFRAAVADSGINAEWRSSVDFPSWAIARAASAADVVVIGRENRGARVDGYWLANAGDILVSAGRPILVVPPGVREPRLDHIMVTWKNTRETRRAVSDALPLLVEADQVTLLHIPEGNDSESGVDDAIVYFSRHGIEARVENHRLGRDAVEDQIFRVAAHMHADLIVAGAYGHARLTERLLGGVTRALVERSPVAVLLSH